MGEEVWIISVFSNLVSGVAREVVVGFVGAKIGLDDG